MLCGMIIRLRMQWLESISEARSRLTPLHWRDSQKGSSRWSYWMSITLIRISMSALHCHNMLHTPCTSIAPSGQNQWNRPGQEHVVIDIKNAIKGPINDRIAFYNSLIAQHRWKVIYQCLLCTVTICFIHLVLRLRPPDKINEIVLELFWIDNPD